METILMCQFMKALNQLYLKEHTDTHTACEKWKSSFKIPTS